ncbi:MAG: acyl carrier protein, partial [Myxococcales bacterium]|nr:acyl carrier protein [Myxococcales bacterium]
AAALLAAPSPREVLDGVREEVGRVLGSPSPPLKVPVRDLGMDSVGAVDLRIALERRFGVALPATLVFEAPSIHAMAERVGQNLK